MIDMIELADPLAGGVTGFIEKAKVIPDGMPVAVRATGEEKPPIDITVTVVEPDPPGGIDRLAEETVIVKSGGGPDDVTVIPSGVEWETVPFVPETVTV